MPHTKIKRPKKYFSFYKDYTETINHIAKRGRVPNVYDFRFVVFG
jgi:hypothetical protein